MHPSLPSLHGLSFNMLSDFVKEVCISVSLFVALVDSEGEKSDNLILLFKKWKSVASLNVKQSWML